MSSSRRTALRLAATLTLANLATPLAGLVDTATAARLPGAAPLAAVGLGAAALSGLLFLFGFLRMGLVGPTARDHGRGDRVGVAAHLLRGLGLALTVGVGLVVAGPLLLPAAVALLGPDPEVVPPFTAYFAARLPGLPAALVVLVLAGWFLGLGDARTPLSLVGCGALVNALLDPLLALGLGLGTAGIGLATALADLIAAVLGLARARHRLGPLRPGLARLRRDRRALGELLRVNRDLFLRNLALQTAFLVHAALAARLGSVALAAQAVLMQVFALSSHLLDGFAFAAETMVGRAVGTGDRSALARAVRHAFEHAGLTALALALLILLGRELWIPLLAGDAATSATVRALLPLAVLVPPAGAAAFVLDGIHAGAVRTAPLRRSMIRALLLFLAAALALVPVAGQAGLWGAFLLFLLARAVFLAVPLWRRGLASLLSEASAATAIPARSRASISSSR